jgi:hypothetical protein
MNKLIHSLKLSYLYDYVEFSIIRNKKTEKIGMVYLRTKLICDITKEFTDIYNLSKKKMEYK